MTRAIRFKPEAEQDLSDAHAWYEGQRVGLGDEMLLCVEAAIESVQRQPEGYVAVEGEIRRALLRRFPYGVFYLVETSEIVVLGVFHAARDPRAWRSRR